VEENLAAFWNGPESLTVKGIPVPEIKPGGILLKVESCSICGSDLRTYRHGHKRIKPPQVIGHEIAGKIVAVGKDVRGFREGDRVSLGADIPCGSCEFCKGGNPNCCQTNLAIGYQFSGGFTRYMALDPLVVSEGPVCKISDSLDYDIAALAEPLACCLNGYEKGRLKPGGKVAIFGAGPVGIMLASLGRTLGASDIFLIDPNKERLVKAGNIVKDLTTIWPPEEGPVESVMEYTRGSGVDLAFTACPVAETHSQAVNLLATGGIVNFFGGLPANSPPLTVDSNLIHYRELCLTGSHGSTPLQHRQAVELLESGSMQGGKFITAKFGLTDIRKGFLHALSQEGLKVIIKPHE